MSRHPAAALVATLLLLSSPAPVVAQGPGADGAQVTNLMTEANGLLTSATRVLARAGDDDAARADALDRLDRAVAAYDEALAVVGRIPAASLAPEARAEVLQIAHYNTACARSLQGRKDEALDALALALEAGFDQFGLVARDTDLDPIRGEPRFAQLLERTRAALAERARSTARDSLSRTALFPYDFTIETLDGQRLSLADLRGRVVIVDYWGTWCPPCRAEVPHFVELQRELGDRLAVVGMTYERGESGPATVEAVRRFAAQLQVNYPLTLLEDERDLQSVPDLRAFPTTLFIDKAGRVRAREVGYRDIEVLRGLVLALDAEPAPPPAPPPETLGPF